MGNKFHFSIHLQFKKDCDISKIEKELGITSNYKCTIGESKGSVKTAKLWFKTDDVNEHDTFMVLKRFVVNMKENFEKIKLYNQMYDGTASLVVYFEYVEEKPYINLDEEILKILSDNKISFEIDFRL